MFQLPKGRSFSKRVYATGVLLAIFLFLLATYFFVHNADKGISKQAKPEIDSEHAREAIKRIKQQKPAGSVVNTAITKKSLEFATHQPAEFTPGDIVYLDGKAYWVNDHGQIIPLTEAGFKPGDIVYKDGKPYIVDANGQLKPFNGALQPGQRVYQNGKWYEVDALGKLVPIEAGTIAKINGEDVIFKDGKWVPLTEAGFKPGDIVYKDGKPYIVDANGQLKPFSGKLAPGQRVYQNGKWYAVDELGNLIPMKEGTITEVNGKPFVLKDGQWVPLAELGLKAGDIVYKDGEAFMIGEDGKLKPIDQLKPGQVVYKDGQFWQVDEAGNLIKLNNGSLVLDSKSRPYSLKDNALIKPDPCTVVHDEDGKVLIVGHDHKLHLLSEGDSCFNESLGEGIKIQDGKVIYFSGEKSTTAKSAAAGQKNHQSTKTSSSDANPPLDQKSKSLWQVNMDQSTETVAAMKAPIEVIRYQKSEKQTAHKKELTFEEAMAKEQADIKSLLAAQQNSNPYTMQNNQSSKIAFLKAAQQKSAGALDERVQSSNYPYTLSVGSFIPATLISGINSDLPGAIIAQVSRNVYDTRTGDHLLIPQGTKLFGQYDSQISYGQSRVIMVWSKLTFPDASTYDLEGMPGADLSGFSGISDQVNNHYFKIFGSALLFSLFGAGSQLSQPANTSSGQSNSQIIYGAIGQQMTQAATKQIEHNMQIQPTLTIRPGTHFNILVTREMVFDQPYQFDVHYR